MNQAPAKIEVDIIVIGGGVAGLWLLNRLISEGYRAILFEQKSLGYGQTIASQGMIHGGVKYTLSGALSGSSEAIAEMPAYWKACLAGDGEVDLTRTQQLSDHFYMWSSESTLSKVTTFFASKALRGRIDKLDKSQHPTAFAHPAFRGSLYRLNDVVLDTASLIKNLYQNVVDYVFTIDWQTAEIISHGNQAILKCHLLGELYEIHPRRMVFTAGKGNQQLLSAVKAIEPKMQTRPLQQVIVKHRNQHEIYAHCIGSGSTPRLTISSYVCKDGRMCWYLGGDLAEKGAAMDSEAFINFARKELEELFPWLEWQDAEFSTLKVSRAEPWQENTVRPDKASVSSVKTEDGTGNIFVAWPTKLTLAPNLAHEALSLLRQQNILPEANGSGLLERLPDKLANHTKPAVADNLWNQEGNLEI